MILKIELQYFGLVNIYKYSIDASDIEIHLYEPYRRRSFRNRCVIAGANNLIHLSVPIEFGRNQKTAFKEVKIATGSRWQKEHWQSILSAYGHSPWFTYYREELWLFYQRPYGYLVDWNLDLMTWVHKKLGVDPAICLIRQKDEIVDAIKETRLDLEERWTPVNFQALLPDEIIRYPQVFEDRHGFQPNLSILDLLFCMGPGALQLLKSQTPKY